MVRSSKYEGFEREFILIVILTRLYSHFSTVLTTCLLILPIHLSKDKEANFESLQCTDESSMGFKRRAMQNPKYQSVAKKILPMLDRRGLFDEM